VKDLVKRENKGGRPRQQVTRDAHLMVRMTAAEKRNVCAKAKAAGMKPSEWFRAAAIKADIVPRLSPGDLQILRMLSGMANNLNQLTKLANHFGYQHAAKACIALLEKINEVIDLLFDGRKTDQR
jgi:hypothetical protein